MKTFIRGVLTTILVCTFTLIPTIMYTEKSINQQLVGAYGKEALATQISESFKENFPDLTEEDITTMEENIRENEKIDALVNKYSEKIIQDLSKKEIEDFDVRQDLKTFITENKQTIEEAIGRKITDQEVEEILNETMENEKVNESYKEIITQARESIPEDNQELIDGYNKVTTDSFMIGLIIASIICIIMIALLKKPYYKWIVNIAIAGIISSFFIALIGGSIALVLNLLIESVGESHTVSVTPVLITSGIILGTSIILLIINSMLDKKLVKENAIS